MRLAKKQHYNKIINQKGFTLVELLLAMVVSTIIVAAVYVAYIAQQNTYLAQEQVAEMQQNLRAAVYAISREVRMAGYDPTSKAEDATIEKAVKGRLEFKLDANGDEDTDDLNETVKLGFSASDDNDDGEIDGGGVGSLGKDNGGGYQPIAENIQRIEFHYLDEDGTVTTTTDDIRTLQISILARARLPDNNFPKNNMIYTPASGPANNWGPYNDNFRRRLLITTIQCRNMGT